MPDQEPIRKRKPHVTNFQDDEASDSYEGDDAGVSNEYEEESVEEEGSDSGVNIVDTDDSLSGDEGQIHEHRRLDRLRENDDDEKSIFSRPRRQDIEYLDAGEDRRVRVEETDPHIYRVPVKRGKQLICILKMNYRLTELKIRASNIEKYKGLGKITSYDVRSIFCNPNDPHYIYLETSDLHTCEMFIGQFMEYLGPYTSTTFMKRSAPRRHKHKQPPPPLFFVPSAARPQLFSYDVNVEKINVGGYYKLKQGKRAYRGDSCCVLEVKNQVATVVVLPRLLSLSDKDRPSVENPPRRITREEFEDYMGDTAIYTDRTTLHKDNELVLLQEGYEVLKDIPIRALGQLSQEKYFQAQREIVPSKISQDNRNVVNIVNQNRRDNERKLPLALNERVVIATYSLRGKDFNNAQGIVRSEPDGHGASAIYKVEFIGIPSLSMAQSPNTETGSHTQTRILHEMNRNQLIRMITIGDHVQVQRGKYRDTTGEVREVVRSSDQKYFLLRIKVDTSHEYIGSLGIDSIGDSDTLNALYDITDEITSDEVRVHPGTWNGLPENKLSSGELIRTKYLVQTLNDEDAVVTFIGHLNARIVTASGEERTCEIENLKAVQRPLNMPMPKDHVGRMVSIESIVRVRDNVETHAGVIGEIIQTSINNPSILFLEPSKNVAQRNIFSIDSRSCDSLVSGRNVDNYNRKLSQTRNTMNIGQQVICMDRQYSGKQGTLISINDKHEGQVQLSEKKITIPLHLLRVAVPLPTRQSMQVEHVPTQSSVNNVFGSFNFSMSANSTNPSFWYNDRSQTTKDMLMTQSSMGPATLDLDTSKAAGGDSTRLTTGIVSTDIANYGADNEDSDNGFEQAWDNF